jgi:4-amino-4-deoxy-L-arabinose transferase-like glycosyltransferase
MKITKRNAHDTCVWILLFIFCLIIIALSLSRYFFQDELEHIHASWYILQGKIPYSDFFENHNPAFWFLIAPLIHVIGENAEVLFVIRGISFLFLMGLTLTVRAISREAGASVRESNYAALLVLSCSILVNKGLEIRPDGPQVFFGLLSCLYFFRHLRTRNPRHMLIAGFLVGISFIILQKIVIFGVGAGISMLWLLWQKSLSWKNLFLYVFGAAIPISCLVLYLFSTGCFHDYILTNWIMNLNRLDPFSPLGRILDSFLENTAFWSLAVASIWTFLFRKRSGMVLQILSFWGLWLLISLFFVIHPYKHYFIFPLAFLAVPAARQIVRLFDHFNCSELCRSGALVLACIVPLCVMTYGLAKSNKPQLELIRYVLNETDSGEKVYDGVVLYNLFRPDLHYFWFGIQSLSSMDAYNRVSGNRFGSYDIYQLIVENKPAFISDDSINISDPRIAKMYVHTPFSHLYQRIIQKTKPQSQR